VVGIFDFHHAVGRGGAPVPLPPDLYPKDSPGLQWFWNAPKRALITLCGVVVVSIVPQIGRTPNDTLVQRLALGVAITLAGVVGVIALMALIPWLWWLFERRALGKRLEAEIDALSTSDLDERISDTEQLRAESEGSRQDAYARRIAWLKGKRAERLAT
jgi:hypothetical protein